MSRSPDLGPVHIVQLEKGPIAYRERGDGPAVLFIHGLLVNADLWRNVAPRIAGAGYRCIAPDWPLGSHEHPMDPAGALGPVEVVEIVQSFLAALRLESVTVVANDTGGAIAQLLVSRYPDRIGSLVLVSCDSFDRFFPPIFRPLQWLARLPGSAWLIVQALRVRSLHRLPMVFGWVSKRALTPEVVDSYLHPSRVSRGIRWDLRRFLRGVDNRLTLDVVPRLADFDKPVLVAWAAEDRLFPVSYGERLAGVFPRAEFVPIADSYTFVSEDQPEQLADLIVTFLGSART
jgi:pimeloyl-ACP methyl ester carboxylesterase